jgi:transmembrane protein 33
MKVVAFAEIAILARVTAGALVFKNSFVTPILFAHFLRMRYFQSPFTKSAISTVAGRIDGLVNRPDMPPVVKQVWATLQQLIGRWSGSTLAGANPRPAAQPQAQRAAR